uniref:M6 family metalloprotease domain-containing protein n=1 Tax=Prevotella sp. TaxID=59823 RepID=UPI004026964A
MKRLFTFCLASLFASSLFAIPALSVWRSVRQADGTTIRLKLVGDEHFHYAVTDDGIPVLSHDGSYYYAHIRSGHLVASDVLAHARDQRKDHEERFAASLNDVKALDAQTRSQAAQKVGTRANVVTGKKKGLVILVQFSNQHFANPSNVLTLGSGETDVNTLYSDMLNKDGYTDTKSGAIGSVHDYFHDQSDGKFDLSFDVIGPVTLSHPYSYYGAPSGNEADGNAPQMVIDACNAIKDKVNFADYDWNDDGEVEQVYIVYAGEGQATGGDDNTIWPHKYSLSDSRHQPLTYNGVTIDTYACSNEMIRATLNGKDRLFYMGIGTICHEFSHCLGLPDFYDTGYGGNVGTGSYDLMCSGSYNGGPEALKNVYGGTGIGTVPAGYTSYEKAFMGWITPTKLGDQPLDIKAMKGLADGGNAYILTNPDNNNEYYLFENRSSNRWDSALPGYGLLVLHVDYDARSWAYNTVNAARDQNHPRMTIVPADGDLSDETLASDTYPTDLNSQLSGNSTPALSFYTGYSVPTTAGLSNIQTAADGTVSFHYTPLTTSAGIASITTDHKGKPQIYTLVGTKADNKTKGVVIIKNADGNTKKVIR